MRRRPEDLGLTPDGDPARSVDVARPGGARNTDAGPSAPEPVWTRAQVVRTPTFWLLVASFSLANLAFQGINISLAPYAQDLGHGDAVAAGVLSLRALLVFLAAPVWGLMSERASSRMVRLAPMAAQAGSCVCFLLAARVEFLWLGVVVYPLGFAGTGLMQEVLWANDFGPTHAWSGALHGDPASRGVQRSGAHCDEPHL